MKTSFQTYYESILPNIAILEPKVLKTLPLYQKKCTMMDALCQGIESWWSVNSTDESKLLSKEAVETIIHWWKEYIFENTDASAEAIMQAANLAGQAICITQTTAPHAMSYKLTSLYGLPHGHAVAICLPEVWEYMTSHPETCIDPRGKEYLSIVFDQIAQSLGCKTPKEAILFLRSMLVTMELEYPKSADYEKDLETLTCSVNPTRLKNNPVPLDPKTLRDFYQSIVIK